MVTKGQFLERPTLIPLPGGLVLEGLSHRGNARPGLLVLPPPALEGGGMDHIVGAELAYAVSHAGHPTLRFNYRGVGGSQGTVSKAPRELLEDALAAFELARDNAHGALPAVASIGASDAVALELVRRHGAAALALVSPTLARAEDLVSLPRLPVCVVVAEHDAEQDRASWAGALEAHGGLFTVIPGADRSWQRNLPLVGKAVAALVARAAGRATNPAD